MTLLSTGLITSQQVCQEIYKVRLCCFPVRQHRTALYLDILMTTASAFPCFMICVPALNLLCSFSYREIIFILSEMRKMQYECLVNRMFKGNVLLFPMTWVVAPHVYTTLCCTLGQCTWHHYVNIMHYEKIDEDASGLICYLSIHLFMFKVYPRCRI